MYSIYSKRPSFIIGFHGCELLVRNQVVMDQLSLKMLFTRRIRSIDIVSLREIPAIASRVGCKKCAISMKIFN